MNMKIYILAASLTAFASCSFLDVEPTVMTGTTYASEEEALYGLAGVYGVINNEAFYGNYYSQMLSNVDDLCYYNRTSGNNFSVWYQHNASSSEIYEAWTEIYQGIGNANTFMEAMENSEFDPGHKLYSEARFLRAYYYFILAQAWGDVPLRLTSTTSPYYVQCEATPQLQILQWVVSEMEACLDHAEESLANAPSRVVKTTMWGILARVYLFMAGESITGTDDAIKKEYYGKVVEYAGKVMGSGKHRLNLGNATNDGYSQMFINMIADVYDTEYYESMWEADFKGNRSSSDNWSNGRIGNVIGLQCQLTDGFSDPDLECNFSYGQYNGSLKLWNLYWTEDRTDAEIRLADDDDPHWDRRQAWNMCPYNYQGKDSEGIERGRKTYYGKTADDPTDSKAVRNCGKYRRETRYEGIRGSSNGYTPLNYPILRYADILLMYAEAYNECNGPDSEVFENCILPIRDRAGISTRPFDGNYDTKETFRQLVRNERGRELVFESLRKYDLIRWGIFVEEMKKYTEDTYSGEWASGSTEAAAARIIAASVQPRHILLPIPNIELGVNEALRQNPLW